MPSSTPTPKPLSSEDTRRFFQEFADAVIAHCSMTTRDLQSINLGYGMPDAPTLEESMAHIWNKVLEEVRASRTIIDQALGKDAEGNQNIMAKWRF